MAQKFALVVGNSEYEDPNIACLVSPAVDVRMLSSVLEDPEVGGFDSVTALVNQSETHVRRGIASLFTRKKPDDLLLLYFSTHGILDENGRLFLATRDTQRDLLKATAISAAFITDEMDNSSSRRQVLILDCCHSGAFARGTKGVLGSSVSTAATFQGNGFGRVVLTATDSTQYAWDGDTVIGASDSSSSVFTRHLIEGLHTGAADEDDDGQITLDELYEYVYRQVLSENPRQTPGKWSYKQQGDLIIARNPHPGHKQVNLPDQLQRALESDFPSTREGAIRELERYLSGSQLGLTRAAEQALEKISVEDDSRKLQRVAAAMLADFRKSQEVHRESPSTHALRRVPRAVAAEPTQKRELPKIANTVKADSNPGQGIELGATPQEALPTSPGSADRSMLPTLFGVPTNEATQTSTPNAMEERPLLGFPWAQTKRESPKPWHPVTKVTLASAPIFILILIIASFIPGVEPYYDVNDESRLQIHLASYAAKVCPDCTQVVSPTIGQLPESNSIGEKHSFTLGTESTYVVAAACSPDPCDIDLYLEGSNRSDVTVGSTTSIQVTPSLEGTIEIGIGMFGCKAEECLYALGVWSNAKPPS